jgi:hypothetical protein
MVRSSVGYALFLGFGFVFDFFRRAVQINFPRRVPAAIVHSPEGARNALPRFSGEVLSKTQGGVFRRPAFSN